MARREENDVDLDRVSDDRVVGELEGQIAKREGQLNAILLVKYPHAGIGLTTFLIAKCHSVY